MQCSRTLELLESVRPGSDDLREPELAEAVLHLQNCPRCADEFAARQSLDQEISGLMQNVAVPAGLQQRLLRALTAPADGGAPFSGAPANDERPAEPARLEPDKSVSPPVESQETSEHVSAGGSCDLSDRAFRRRRWFKVAALISACLLCGLGIGLYTLWLPPTLTLHDFRQQVDVDFDTLRDFDGSEADARLPDHGWQSRLLTLRGPKGQCFPKSDSATPHTIAVYEFQYRAGRRGAVTGVLLVIPANRLVDPPKETSMSGAQAVYVTTPSSNYASVAWTSKRLVYVCAVRGSAADLERLQRSISVRPA